MSKSNHSLLFALLLLCLTLFSLPVVSQTPEVSLTTNTLLTQYVQSGLESNLALKQKEFSLQKSLAALKEARGKFLPSLSIEARYSRAGGGRVIEFPVGDLVNPMQLTLNQLLIAQGQSAVFPTNIENVAIPFLREEEHDTHLRLVQPLFQPAVYFNWKIKKDLRHVEEAAVQVYRRQLIADIKTAYFNYLKTLKVREFLEQSRSLLEENVRVSQSLFNNDKCTQEIPLRAQAELSTLQKQISGALKDCETAAAYFNFLLNRPLEESIQTPDLSQVQTLQSELPESQPLSELQQHALQHREEFQQLFAAIAAAEHTRKLHQSSILPTLSAVVDYGYQGEKYSFTGNDDYWMASLVLNWNLFNGGQDKAKKQQALMDKKRLVTQRIQLESQILLQVKQAYLSFQEAQASYQATQDILDARKQAFDIVAKKYAQDMVIQLEYNKARNDYTQAMIEHIIAHYDLNIKDAQLQQVAAKN